MLIEEEKDEAIQENDDIGVPTMNTHDILNQETAITPRTKLYN